MTQEEKMLLIKDLSARLPYAVVIEHTSGFRGTLHDLTVHHMYDGDNDAVHSAICYTDFFGDEDSIYIEYFKPYLFPLSSITLEQEKELSKLGVSYGEYAIHDDIRGLGIMVEDAYIFFEFCYKNHIDFLGLIQKGLALDATGKSIY